jgi:protoheme IX farnesyltransferase
MWTPPHFWALALFKSGDYERAGVPMMPNVAGHRSTRRQIFVYSVIVAFAGVLPTVIGHASMAYGAVAACLGVAFVWYAWRVLRAPEQDASMRPAKALFGYSLLYLFAIFAVLLADNFASRIASSFGV